MKLDDLCAIKVMGWTRESPLHEWKTENGLPMVKQTGFSMWSGVGANHFHPSTSLDDALVCLERACPDGFDIERMPHHPDERLRCVVTANCAQARGLNPSVAIAMCLCSLRAMGVPESEIQEAMK